MITLMLAKFMINDMPHAVGLLPTPNHSWDNVWMSCQEAAKILGKPLTEQDIPANWDELRRLHKDLWAQVYGKGYKAKPVGGNPIPAAATVYHITSLENLDGILSTGLIRGDSDYIFFLYDYNIAHDQAKGMAGEGYGRVLLKVILLSVEIDECEVGEMFPELYSEAYGTEPPPDASLREHMENPRVYRIAEVSCSASKVPPEQVSVLEKFP